MTVNTKIGQLIKRRREQLGYSQQEIADFIQVTKSAVSRWESGQVDNMGRSKIQKLAKVLKISPVDIVMGDVEEEDEEKESAYQMKSDFIKVPILGKIAAGSPLLANENVEGFEMIESEENVDFGLTVKGDSMINARIMEGDVVFIRMQPDVDNGDIAAVVIDDEATLKRVYKINGSLVLRSENPKYKDIIIKKSDHKNVKIIGKAVSLKTKLY
jgi:repressor LexA